MSFLSISITFVAFRISEMALPPKTACVFKRLNSKATAFFNFSFSTITQFSLYDNSSILRLHIKGTFFPEKSIFKLIDFKTDIRICIDVLHLLFSNQSVNVNFLMIKTRWISALQGMPSALTGDNQPTGALFKLNNVPDVQRIFKNVTISIKITIIKTKIIIIHPSNKIDSLSLLSVILPRHFFDLNFNNAGCFYRIPERRFRQKRRVLFND